MAFGQGFAGGYSDLLEAPVPPVPPLGGGGAGRRPRYHRPAPWTPPKPPKPEPVRIRAAIHLTWSLSVRVVAIRVLVSSGAMARRRWRELRDSAEAAVALAWLDGGTNLAVALAVLDSVERSARW